MRTVATVRAVPYRRHAPGRITEHRAAQKNEFLRRILQLPESMTILRVDLDGQVRIEFRLFDVVGGRRVVQAARCFAVLQVRQIEMEQRTVLDCERDGKEKDDAHDQTCERIFDNLVIETKVTDSHVRWSFVLSLSSTFEWTCSLRYMRRRRRIEENRLS